MSGAFRAERRDYGPVDEATPRRGNLPFAKGETIWVYT